MFEIIRRHLNVGLIRWNQFDTDEDIGFSSWVLRWVEEYRWMFWNSLQTAECTANLGNLPWFCFEQRETLRWNANVWLSEAVHMNVIQIFGQLVAFLPRKRWPCRNLRAILGSLAKGDFPPGASFQRSKTFASFDIHWLVTCHIAEKSWTGYLSHDTMKISNWVPYHNREQWRISPMADGRTLDVIFQWPSTLLHNAISMSHSCRWINCIGSGIISFLSSVVHCIVFFIAAKPRRGVQFESVRRGVSMKLRNSS